MQELVLDPELTKAAQAHAEFSAARGSSASGHGEHDGAARVSIAGCAKQSNTAISQLRFFRCFGRRDDLKKAHKAWTTQPTSYYSIVCAPRQSHAGVGIARCPEGQRWSFAYVVLFANLSNPARTAPSPTPPPADPAGLGLPAGAPAGWEAAMLTVVNAERAKLGLSALQLDVTLTRVAQLHASDMAQRRFLSHCDPLDGSGVGDRARRQGFDWVLIAENIARGQKTAEAAHVGWVGSPGHFANMVCPGVELVGVACAQVPGEDVVWVQVYGAVKTSKPALARPGFAVRPRCPEGQRWSFAYVVLFANLSNPARTAPSPTPPPADPAGLGLPAGAPAGWEAAMLTVVNAERAKLGLSALQLDVTLTRVAQLHASDMAQRRFLSHCDPLDGSGVGDRARRQGFDWVLIAENIARGQKTAEAAHVGWVGSPGHFANMVCPGVELVGVACAQVPGEDVVWVQVYGAVKTSK
ncbi:hypothetical protein TSOC_013427 [Tetrabaena socialis]|uniref:SCP domain-containing protein n=1 Tax=Tetrabaena socialis TaxID=47790 RepID=A0A2J7ZKD9_9CHLO|nr:hypothetical protein TSOC_013427 [Tetrabaena socialis]|eukprot:PNH00738.1 hypothetical protein TSOC_013427 [Tetrabaena socialis]